MEEFYFTTENKLNSAILYGPLQMYSYLHVSVLCHKTSKEKECFTGHNEHWGTAQGGHDAIPMCVLYWYSRMHPDNVLWEAHLMIVTAKIRANGGSVASSYVPIICRPKVGRHTNMNLLESR